MSAHHEIEHEQETVPGEAIPPRQPAPPSPRPPGRPWFTVVIVTIVVLLVLAISVGVVIAVQLSRQHVTPGTPTPNPTATGIVTTTPVPTSTAQPTVTPTPLPPGQWVQSLTDYRVTQLLAAPGHPNVLYACAIAPGVPVEYQSVETVLRSADFGATWQDVGKRAQMSRGCELVINPTDSYEIYVATSSNPPSNQAVPSYVLVHTVNGGDTWETIHPAVDLPGLNTQLPWQGIQLSSVGNRLYSVQSLPISPTPTPQGPRGWYPTALARLLTSADGGHTWHTLDTQLATAGRTAETYAVNPAHPSLFYELAYVPAEPGTAFPSLELYQSIDGGQTWQSVLQHLPWLAPLSPAAILTGSENPDVVYLTNTRCPAAQALHASAYPLALPLAGSPFSMCMSSDGGKNWRTLSAPSQFAQTMGGGVVDQKGRLYAQVATSGSVEVWRYDPAETWSKGVQAPRGGNVLAGTPAGANGTTVIWFMTTSGQTALFRYVI